MSVRKLESNVSVFRAAHLGRKENNVGIEIFILQQNEFLRRRLFWRRQIEF
jgi:hypothetical protein